MENNNPQPNAPHPAPKGPGSLDGLMNWYHANSRTVRGVGALLLGAFALFYTRHVILNFFVFLVGVVLVYYGLSLLRVTQITNIIDKLVGKIKD